MKKTVTGIVLALALVGCSNITDSSGRTQTKISRAGKIKQEVVQ